MISITKTTRAEIPLQEIMAKFKLKGEVVKFCVPSRMKFADADKATDGKRLFPPLIIEYVPALRQEPNGKKDELPE